MNIGKVAKSLFIRISDSITKTVVFENQWPDAKGNILYLVRLSTDEKRQEDKPQKGIFYLHFYYGGKDSPVPVGIGSFAKNEITVDSEVVSENIWRLFSNFSFGVIAYFNPNMTFEQMKKEVLPHYQKVEAVAEN